MVTVDAKTLVTTKNRTGFTADTSMASICSVTFMEPNSAPILEPTLPAQINDVTSGAKARIMAIVTREGSHDVAPKVSSEGRDCFVKTKPVTKPVNEIRTNELLPMR